MQRRDGTAENRDVRYFQSAWAHQLDLGHQFGWLNSKGNREMHNSLKPDGPLPTFNQRDVRAM